LRCLAQLTKIFGENGGCSSLYSRFYIGIYDLDLNFIFTMRNVSLIVFFLEKILKRPNDWSAEEKLKELYGGDQQ
jgi:hypothetical protein